AITRVAELSSTPSNCPTTRFPSLRVNSTCEPTSASQLDWGSGAAGSVLADSPASGSGCPVDATAVCGTVNEMHSARAPNSDRSHPLAILETLPETAAILQLHF